MTIRTICITNQKGGVGKNTTAVSLAYGLARKGKQVLLIDLDPQGQSATALGLLPEPGAFYLLTMGISPQETTFVRQWVRASGRENLSLIPSNQQTMAAQTVLNAQDKPISAIHQAINRFIKDDLDYIIFDTAPSVGGIQERAVWASDFVIIPTATEFLSADGVSQIVQMMSILQTKKQWKGSLLGVLPTFYDEQTRESKSTYETLRDTFGGNLLLPIHRATILRECAAEGLTIFEKDPDSRAGREYETLVRIVTRF